MDEIEMVISSRNLPLVGNKKVIVLKEKDGSRIFPIYINPLDAETISAGIKNIQSTKLHTYDFICSIITGFGSTLQKVLIHEINGENIQAAVIIKMKDGSFIQIRCIPADAISIALKAGLPIFVTEDLLAREGL